MRVLQLFVFFVPTMFSGIFGSFVENSTVLSSLFVEQKANKVQTFKKSLEVQQTAQQYQAGEEAMAIAAKEAAKEAAEKEAKARQQTKQKALAKTHRRGREREQTNSQ